MVRRKSTGRCAIWLSRPDALPSALPVALARPSGDICLVRRVPQGHPEWGKALVQYAPWDRESARAIIVGERGRQGALLPILHALQGEFGYIDKAAIPLIAEILNLSRAEVYGVVTFYHDFTPAPRGRHVLRLCRAEACQAAGADALAARAEAALGIAVGGTTADRQVTLEPVYCLGLCAAAPSAMLDGRVVGRLDERKLDALLEEIAR